MARDPEKNEDRLERAGRASVSVGLMGPLLAEMTNEIHMDLIRQARGKALNHDSLILAIGRLDALHSVNERLEAEQRHGDEAAIEEFRENART